MVWLDSFKQRERTPKLLVWQMWTITGITKDSKNKRLMLTLCNNRQKIYQKNACSIACMLKHFVEVFFNKCYINKVYFC